jgi:transposase
VDAAIYRYRKGIPGRDLPERYGYWKAIHKRYRRRCESGVFASVFEALAIDADVEFMMIDATNRIVPRPFPTILISVRTSGHGPARQPPHKRDL